MKLSSRSVIIFGSLFLLVIFLGGFRLGRLVEKSDKSYVPPTRIPAPTILIPTPTPPPLNLKTYTHPCGVSFSYPSTLEVEKDASEAAKLTDGNQMIEITCEKAASNSARIVSTVSAITPTISPKDVTTWEVRNAKTRQVISFSTSSNLAELILKTLNLE